MKIQDRGFIGADDQQLLLYISSASSLAKQPAMCMLALCFASSLPSSHNAATEVEISAISATDLSNLSHKKRKSYGGGAKECCVAKENGLVKAIGTILPCLDDISATDLSNSSRSTCRNNKKQKSYGGAKECCVAKDSGLVEAIGTILPCLDDISATDLSNFSLDNKKRKTYGGGAKECCIAKDSGLVEAIGIILPCLDDISATELSDFSLDNKKQKSYGGGAKECCVAKDRGPVEAIGTILPCLDDMSASRCIAFTSRSTYDALSRTHKMLRKLIRSDYIYELRRELGVVEQWIYMFATGDAAWKAFDPKRRMWMSLPPCSTDMAFIMSDKESLSAGTQLLWMGKEITNYAIFRYVLSTNSWSRGPLMNQPRCLFASASCGEHAFVAGGNYDGVVLKSVEKYDSLQCMWECLPDMNIARQKSSGCYMDGKFYVIGGRDEEHKRLTSGEEYNPQIRSWRVISDMFPLPAGREIMEPSPPLVAVVNNKLYSIDSSVNVLRVYNKASNTWSILGDLPVRADLNNGWGLAFKALGDELYVIGGYWLPSAGRPLMAMFSWKPEENEGRLVWNVVTFTRPGAGTFLSNCAVMAC